MTIWLVIGALSEFVLFDILSIIGFRQLHRAVLHVRVSSHHANDQVVAPVCDAVKTACVVYFRTVHCLQRSMAVTRMLRRRGVPAELVIGYRPTPIDSHAWVEVNGTVVSDHIEHLESYLVLDRW